MEIKILSIAILQRRNGPDKIKLEFASPCGTWPYDGNASATIDVASGDGSDYVKKHFAGMDFEIINV